MNMISLNSSMPINKLFDPKDHVWVEQKNIYGFIEVDGIKHITKFKKFRCEKCGVSNYFKSCYKTCAEMIMEKVLK